MNVIKIFFINLFLVFSFVAVNAQTTPTYLSHTIVAGETLSALAKQYATTVGNIMRLNHMNTASVLTIGEVVKIPTGYNTAKIIKDPATPPTTTPVVKTTIAPPPSNPPTVVSDAIVTNPNGTPIMHTVAPRESLYTLAKQYHTTIPILKQWNNMTSDVIVDGHKLIVGYRPFSHITSTSMTQKVGVPTAQPSIIVQQPTVTTQQQNISATSLPTVDNNAQPIKPAPDNAIHATTVQTAMPPVSTTTVTTTAPPPTVSEPTIPSVSVTPIIAKTPQNDAANMNNPEGYFASTFGLGTEGRSLQSGSGSSMTFKTASGWNDKKYYILMNDVPPGSIVKVMAGNYKVIYAKVLWSMNAMKENDGLNYRISTAAASALGLSESKFPLTVTYFE